MCVDGARRSQDISYKHKWIKQWPYELTEHYLHFNRHGNQDTNQGAEPETELIIQFLIKATYEC